MGWKIMNRIKKEWEELKVLKYKVKIAKNKNKGLDELMKLCNKYNFNLYKDGDDSLIVKRLEN